MNRIATCGIIGFMLVSFPGLIVLAEAQPAVSTADSSSARTEEMYGEVREGLAAYLLCHKTRFEVGEPIPLSFGLILVGPGLGVHDDETAALRIRVFKPEPIMDPENYSWFEVTGPDGGEVPYHGPYSSVPLYEPSEDNSTVLRHGDTLGRIHEDLSDVGRFSLTAPGTYKVGWGYATHSADGIGAGGPLRSNEVTIEIVVGS